MKIGRLRLTYTLTMSGLTLIAVTACRWQWRRYHESVARWDKINASLTKDDPEQLEAMGQQQMAESQYCMVKAAGEFGAEQALVMRVRNSRMGFFLVKPFHFKQPTLDGKKTILVNAGWVPEDIAVRGDEIRQGVQMGRFG